MTLTTAWVLGYTDSIAQAISDFNTTFVASTTTGNPSSATILAGVSGTGVANTYGRVLTSNDSQTELGLLQATYTSITNVAAYLGGLQSPTGFYQQWFTVFDKLDSTVSGLNTYLTANSLMVNGWFARAFNVWCSIAVQVTPGRSSANAPVPIAPANYSPSSDVDSVWTFTCGAGAVMTTSTVGTNPSTSVNGGGMGQLVIYKANAPAAIGGATFTISYKNSGGATATATFTTASGVPTGSGSLATAYIVSGAIGSSIVSVTGIGMTSGEQYVLGIRQVRALSGY